MGQVHLGPIIIGMKVTTLKAGWGAKHGMNNEWGDLKDATIFPTGLSKHI